MLKKMHFKLITTTMRQWLPWLQTHWRGCGYVSQWSPISYTIISKPYMVGRWSELLC